MGPVPSRPRINTQSQGLTKLLGELETLVQAIKLTLGQGTMASGKNSMNLISQSRFSHFAVHISLKRACLLLALSSCNFD